MSTWDDKPNDYEHAVKMLEAYFDECSVLKRELKEQRTAIIEECAKVAELIETEADLDLGIAAAIRVLKDKP